MKQQNIVSVVIPTFNRKKSVTRLIHSILQGSYTDVEIIVIDDSSDDGTYGYLLGLFKENHKVRIIRNKQHLYTAGSRNLGIQLSKGRYIFFVDDDNVLDKKTIENLVTVLRNNKAVGEIGPVNYSFANKLAIVWAWSRRNMWTTYTYQPRSLEKKSDMSDWITDDIPNAFMVRKSDLVKNHILFNSNYEIMYEESDFAYQIRRAGYDIRVVRNAKIYHDIEETRNGAIIRDYWYHFLTNPRRIFVFARNRVIFHTSYSTFIQRIGICLFWQWIFALYYSYKFVAYHGFGSFSLKQKLTASLHYFRGALKGTVLTLHI